MKVNIAHLSDRSTFGGWINFAVFNARTQSGSEAGNRELLRELTAGARKAGYKIDHAALVYRQEGRIRYYGSKKAVNYLLRYGVPRWNGTLDYKPDCTLQPGPLKKFSLPACKTAFRRTALLSHTCPPALLQRKMS
ncbi:MAG: hypothetical protein ACLFV2_08510 [Desulfurivibrionaceae bacterium]